jgi:CubicO group peptidase (beta-lactamase class C family)
LTPILLFALSLVLQGQAASEIDRAVEEGIGGGVYPGAVVMVGTGQRVLYARGYGHFTWSAGSRAPDADSTLWDLASLTKVVAATPAAMLLVQDGRLDLDHAVQKYLPEFQGEGKERVTVRNLLEHRSGLRAFLPLNDDAATAEEARQLVLEEPLRWGTGGRVVYSDLNAMLLAWVVEVAAGEPLDQFVAGQLYARAGMSETMFRPSRALYGRIAPVGLWRGHVIAGQLHDQNAVRLGGVSGHAGLYSTGGDLARYAQLYLEAGMGADGEQVLAPAIVRHFTRRGPGNRALGWEMRDSTSTDNTGALLSNAAYGHGGYTGSSIWIDPERDVFVILLTNRVYSPRTRNSITKLKRIRGRVADAAVALRGEMCTPDESRAPARC